MQNLTPQLLGPNLGRVSPAPVCILEPSLKGRYVTCVAMAGDFKNPTLVADTNTFSLCGEAIAAELKIESRIVLRGDVHADMKESIDLAKRVQDHDAIIAVGSGTLNDICKYAAHLLGIPYVVFATAPSMNGYVSATASLLKDGLKTSHPAKMPAGAFFDMEILSNAPYRLIRSGIGDTLCRSVVQADWLLSHLLLDTSYDEAPFVLMKPYEGTILKHAALFSKRDPNAMEALTKALIIGGFGMVMCGGSYPASQGEHTIAHVLEMHFPDIMNTSFHGEQIAVTSLYMEGLQRMILNLPHLPVCRPLVTGGQSFPEYEIKKSSFSEINNRIQANWPDMKRKIEAVLLPENTLETVMKAAGLPLMPNDIGLTNEQLLDASAMAVLVRNRFGFLDLQFAP